MNDAHGPPDMRRLVTQLGAHPADGLGLDLDAETGRAAWWIAAIVLAGAGAEARGLEAFRRLRERALDQPGALGHAAPETVAACLEGLGERRAAPLAARLVRASRALEERWGSLEALGADCDGLEALGSRLARLAPGVGAGTVLRFLRPLRRAVPAAADTPLLPQARAAAEHLGWVGPGEDEAGAPDALLHRWREAGEPVAFQDLEAALERLGARACLRDRPDRCPLGDACPAR